MAFWNRHYDVYAMLGDPAANPPWVYDVWQDMFEAINPVVRTARGRASIRSSQSKPRTESPQWQGMSIGRIGWNKDPQKKWTHARDGFLASGQPTEFRDYDLWAPSGPACVRDGLPPDVYFSMWREGHSSSSPHPLKFNSSCVLAVASDLHRNSMAQDCAMAISRAIHSLLQAHDRRLWGDPMVGGRFFGNAINDLLPWRLFKVGPRHATDVSLSMLDGRWTPF